MKLRREQIKTGALRCMALLIACVFLSTSVVSAEKVPDEELQAFYTNSPFYNPNFNTCATEASDTGVPIIALDPGHSGEDKTVPDKETGLHDHDYPNHPEMEDMWDVAQIVAKKLKDKGYYVVMTKGQVQDYVSLRARSDAAVKAKADLAVSIHDQAGSKGGLPFTGWGEIYAQTTDGYRKNYETGKRAEFGDPKTFKGDKTAAKSQEYAQKFATARNKAEGATNRKVTVNSFDGREKDGVDPGNLAQVQLFSKQVPWVYNEVGGNSKGRIGLSDADKQKYANGIIAGVEASVPAPTNAGGDTTNTGGTGTTGGATNSGGTVAMERVDTSDFKPDPDAVKKFNSDNLPKIQKFIPLYVKAAQAEGVPQNWEILAGLHGTETNYGTSFKPNFTGIYSGPFQEDPRQLAAYLKDKNYAAGLKDLVTPGGQPISHDKVTDEQFITLARLALHHWAKPALGNNWNDLKEGPMQFNPTVDSGNLWWKIMGIWNHGAENYQGFNGYDQGAHKMGLPTEFGTPFGQVGAATAYFLLKNWEASGGMVTTASSTNCAAANSGSVDCNGAQGTVKILCEAKKYDPVSYELSGRAGHQGGKAWHESCPTIGPSCVLDCSGLISVAIYDAFGVNTSWTTYTMLSDKSNWKIIPVSDIKPGDAILPNEGHVEIVEEVNGNNIKTFGAHNPHVAQPKQVGELDFYKTGDVWKAVRYVGKGVR
ncbi:MAG TPA: N-acetylmuramoyl-L-alanine amidase [Candidatus Saccharimonadales bacterium]|nr:N-acetylmuramoyl-L-alanine amidase [Candidatus Saccharimonadales bacterium]